ncbi:MAG: IclR family transcriptional regulator [Pigmentiphaga sp.]|nr:IclR family transcriptional regulator [Pigmentiphaga sp.]
MSSASRVFAILNLFSPEKPVWATDDIIETLGYTRPTGYRYVRELVEAGFLQKVAAGRYGLGARIAVLDLQLRQTDPVLRAAVPWMHRLVEQTGFDAVLSSLWHQQVVDTHRVSPDDRLSLSYGRGRVRPLFRGAAPKVILAHLRRHPLRRIYEIHAAEAAANGIGGDWTEFRRYFTAIRKAGFYFSDGELEPQLGAAAVPLFDAGGEVLGALALVSDTGKLRAAGAERLAATLRPLAREIQAVLNAV